MNDLIPIVFFVGCVLATFGLVRACGWLSPATSAPRPDLGGGGGGGTSTSTTRHKEGMR
jgi:hypothetical protein